MHPILEGHLNTQRFKTDTVVLNQGGGSGLGLTQNSWFNSCHGLFSLLTLIINANTLSLKHLMSTFTHISLEYTHLHALHPVPVVFKLN